MNDFLVVLSTLAAVAGFGSALIGIYNSVHARETRKEVQQVSVRVNGNIAALVARIDQLTAVMHENDLAVPPPITEIPETEMTE